MNNASPVLAEVDAGQIPDRVIVFRTRQSPHQHKSRITGTLNGIGQHEFLGPADPGTTRLLAKHPPPQRRYTIPRR
jgi:hypothetical protein